MENLSFVSCESEKELTNIKQTIQQKIYMWKSRVKMENDENAILDLMLQHLTTEELINACLVSRVWNAKIGKTKTFKKRVVLKCSEENLVQKPERNYGNLEIQIRNTQMEIRNAEELIKCQSSSLKSLKIIKFGGFNCMLNNSILLCNLEKLEIQVIGGRLSGGFLSKVNSLTKLVLNGIAPEGLYDCLSKNAQLKELKIYENSFINYFNKDISKAIAFKLDKLAIHDHYNQTDLRLNGEFQAEKWTKRMWKNFNRFIATQNLKSLHLDSCHAHHLGLIVAMQSLETLEINNLIGDIILKELRMTSNNIRNFITNAESENLLKLFCLIRELKKLKAIFIKLVSIELLIFISEVFPFIKQINYSFCKKSNDIPYFLEKQLCFIIIENMLSIHKSSKDDFIKYHCN